MQKPTLSNSYSRTTRTTSKNLPKNHAVTQAVSQSVSKLLNSNPLDKQTVNRMQSEVKLLEFHNIKTLQDCTIGISQLLKRSIEDLDSGDLTNKQKSEIRFVAQLEAYKIIKALVDTIKQLKQLNQVND